jgi:serine/threonine-protein kinase
MTNPEAQRLLQTARQLEERGQTDAAIDAYHRAAAADDAARLMFRAGRPDEAGGYLLNNLGLTVVGGKIDPRALEALNADGRARLLKAAICFTRGKQVDLGIDLMVWLGEVPRAVETLTKLGDPVRAQRLQADFKKRSQVGQFAPPPPAVGKVQAAMNADGARRLEADGKHQLALEAYLQLRMLADAARMSRLLGQIQQAAQLFSDGAKPYESALCFIELGETGKALDQFCRVPRDDARYREAAVQAIRLASQLNHLDFSLENFLTSFLRDPPRSTREADAFYEMARLYQRHDFADNARDALVKLLDAVPDYRDARERVEQIDKESRGSAMVYEKILREEQAFRASGSDLRKRPGNLDLHLPDLPDLPALPDLPPRPGSSPPVASRTRALGATPTPVIAPSRPAEARSTPAEAKPAGQAAPSQQQPAIKPGTNPAPLAPTREPAPAGHQAPPANFTGFNEGSILANRYKLGKKLGEGGMASVFKAEDLELGEHVAIKVFTQTTDDENLIARFKQELTLSRKLTHPNIIRLHDIGTFLGYRFISMELLEGRDLNNYVGKPIDLERGLDWLAQACRGLHAAHERGVVHRDVKPHNIFVCSDGTVKVMDFGIAKRQESPGMTVGNMIAGTPDYMSPEQISGFSSVTQSTDIYAIGITAYQMFTSKLPFEHPELVPLLMKHLNEAPKPPRELNPNIPPALEKVILKLIEKRPEQRYASCAEAADAFEAIRRSLPR